MPYWNVTAIANQTTTIVDMAQQVNDQILFGWGFIGIQMMMAVILTVAFFMTTNDAPKSLLATGWFLMLSGILLFALGLIPVLWTILCVAALAFGILFYARRE